MLLVNVTELTPIKCASCSEKTASQINLTLIFLKLPNKSLLALNAQTAEEKSIGNLENSMRVKRSSLLPNRPRKASLLLKSPINQNLTELLMLLKLSL
jgi:hypothetical protein